MFIQTEATPNPATLKFLPGRTVLADGTADYRSPEEAALSPLAQALFGIEGVTGVFLGSDFVSVSRKFDKHPSVSFGSQASSGTYPPTPSPPALGS